MPAFLPDPQKRGIGGTLNLIMRGMRPGPPARFPQGTSRLSPGFRFLPGFCPQVSQGTSRLSPGFEATATGPAHTSGNVVYTTDGYFTSRNTNGPGTLIGEAMHMKDFGNSSGGIFDAAFADALHLQYKHAPAGGDNDLAASSAFHSYIENACPATW